jgi:hypothetical protein
MIKLANFDLCFQALRYADMREPGVTVLCIQVGTEYKMIQLEGEEDLAYRKFREDNDAERAARMTAGSQVAN